MFLYILKEVRTFFFCEQIDVLSELRFSPSDLFLICLYSLIYRDDIAFLTTVD